jgi:heat shock protein 1/8
VVVNISKGLFDVIASTGNTHLGGADFDNRMINFCKTKFMKKNKIKSLSGIGLLQLQMLRRACEKAKKRLSEGDVVNVIVKNFYNDTNLWVKITRKLFNDICKDLFILCIKPLDDVLRSCGYSRDDIDEIILVGGATRMPTIQDNIKRFFKGKEPTQNINPDEVVAAGAAIQAHIIAFKDEAFAENVVLLDAIPLSLGIETIGGVMNVVIPRNTTIPVSYKKKYTTDSDYETSVIIKIYQGERKMTKDNFFVGQFELSGLESAPRGIAEIEVVIAVDINGIINVRAIDKKNEENKNSITVTGNKGRLSQDKIAELVKEAAEMDKSDKLDRLKKQYYYEIEDLCSNIIVNINTEEIKLKSGDKQIILDDVGKIKEWLNKQTYSDRNKKDYLEILKRIKGKYGSLILKLNNESNNIKGQSTDTVTATTVYGNDEDDPELNKLYEELENDEFGITDEMDEEDKKRIKEKREYLVSLCYSIFDILSMDNLNIEQEYIDELKDYIDDVLLWIHVADKIECSEYDERIDIINKSCDKIMNKYDNLFEVKQFSKKEELEQLCFAIKSSLLCNLFKMDDNTEKLGNQIDTTLDWLIVEMDNSLDNQVYQDKIDEINKMCNDVYELMLPDIGSKSNDTNIIDNLDTELDELVEPENGGTSIFSLKKIDI